MKPMVKLYKNLSSKVETQDGEKDKPIPCTFCGRTDRPPAACAREHIDSFRKDELQKRKRRASNVVEKRKRCASNVVAVDSTVDATKIAQKDRDVDTEKLANKMDHSVDTHMRYYKFNLPHL